MSDEELTLENIRSKKTFVKIHKNENKAIYIDGPRARRFTVPGKWEKMPLFPDCRISFSFETKLSRN